MSSITTTTTPPPPPSSPSTPPPPPPQPPALAPTMDVAMVGRLVAGFYGAERGGAAAARAARVVDGYLAEVAGEGAVTAEEFVAVAAAVPAEARESHDKLYQAIDTFIKTHPSLSKHDRKNLCNLIDARRLSTEASTHASKNERLPIRFVIQVLFSESTKLNRLYSGDWSGSFSGPKSPNMTKLDAPGRCPSKREVLAQQQEIRRLRDDIARLHTHCHTLQAQVDKLSGKKKKRGFFSFLFKSNNDATSLVHRFENYDGNSVERPMSVQHKKWRTIQQNSTSSK